LIDSKTDQYFQRWQEAECTAERMPALIGRLYRDHGVVTMVYGRSLVNRSPVDIIQAHRIVEKVLEDELSVRDTLPVLEAVASLDLAPARIDIGRLFTSFKRLEEPLALADFVARELAEVDTGYRPLRSEPQDVVLYGFGRIGRLMARVLVGKAGGGRNFRLRAVVVRPGAEDDVERRRGLLARDSVHGTHLGTIEIDEEDNALVVNGNMVRILYSDAPEEVDYKQYGIGDAILVDNTGKWRDHEGLSRHLKAPGISRVLLTAPGKGDIPNIVYGVNHEGIANGPPILSAASCTTNAIVPVLKTMHEKFGIVHGHVESCHSYTNDQNLIDNYHKNARRGRSAALNMVVTSTGAAKAVAKALPDLAGRLTGNAIRVPTPNVSLAILNLQLARETSMGEVNRHLRKESFYGPLQYQIDYTNSPDIVSSDMVGNLHAGIVDSEATIADGEHCVLYVWYDNEYGYTRQVVRCMEEMSGLMMKTYPR